MFSSYQRKGMRRGLAAITAVGAAALASSCGLVGGGPGGGAADGEVVLRFPSWQWGQPGYDEFYTEAIEEFERSHPNVKIEKIPVESASFADQMVKMHASNDPPEINQFLTQLYYQAASAGWYEELEPRLEETDIEANWSPFLDEAAKFDGKKYGIWISGSSQALMYNKDMLKEAGVQPPTTPEELLSAAKALTKSTPDGKQYGYSITTKMDVNGYIYGLAPLVAGFGGGWTENGKPDVLNPANAEAIKFEKALIDAGVTPIGADRVKAREIFYQGDAAMLIEGPWVMTSAQAENPDIVPKLGVAPIPFPNQSAGTSNGFAIAKNQDHKEEAWEFIQMIMSQEWQEKYGEMTGVPPGRQDSLTQEALDKAPWLEVFSEAQDTGVSYVNEGLETRESEIDTMIAENVSPVFFGDRSVDEALVEINQDLQTIIDE